MSEPPFRIDYCSHLGEWRDLLAKVERPDWKLRDQKLSCRCADCARVMAFARDPGREVSPCTLVLTKTRWRHKARIKEYRPDLERMKTLVGMATAASGPMPPAIQEWCRQLQEVLTRQEDL